MNYIVDEVMELNESKLTILDASYDEGSDRHAFCPSIMMLGTVGDYDAQCHMVCSVPAGSTRCCIKCNIAGVRLIRICNTRVFGQRRRYLETNHQRRLAQIRGVTKQREPRLCEHGTKVYLVAPG